METAFKIFVAYSLYVAIAIAISGLVLFFILGEPVDPGKPDQDDPSSRSRGDDIDEFDNDASDIDINDDDD